MEKLFVYGTLGPGRPNAKILTDIGEAYQRVLAQVTAQDGALLNAYVYTLKD